MVKFTASILKFGEQGEKTGWTYLVIPAATANKMNPGVRKVYRVKGKIDKLSVEKLAIMPRGNGDFIMPINAAMRKGLGKRNGAIVQVHLETDNSPLKPSAELLECLADEPAALAYFNSLPQSHRNYFNKWIESAKTEPTKAKRIALVIRTMLRKMDFGAMLREEREERKKLEG